MLLQVVLTLGIVLAQAINIGTQHIAGYGWRISLMFAGVPALVLTLGGLLLPDTPNSLIERGHQEQGKQVPDHFMHQKKKTKCDANRSVARRKQTRLCCRGILLRHREC